MGPVDVPPVWMAVLAALFLAGALAALSRVGARLGRGLVITRPLHVVSAETAATGAVLGSSALGSPVSMTQSITAGVVGVAASEGARRVRWQAAGPRSSTTAPVRWSSARGRCCAPVTCRRARGGRCWRCSATFPRASTRWRSAEVRRWPCTTMPQLRDYARRDGIDLRDPGDWSALPPDEITKCVLIGDPLPDLAIPGTVTVRAAADVVVGACADGAVADVVNLALSR
ncbi:inorganic phosphate transporter [Microbispora sp. KK1-11]|uniref:inorganic phosphate transporter n=1 Tax=Microbispora sp. KK1-11 TaxID=2053005 RepID=UPI0011585D82|nr:inorganic phosphate transporter [Microbispora sp. KK1-11]TQS26804.1 inorganic phosphate transporter [Microbispora sp. KK1-11]